MLEYLVSAFSFYSFLGDVGGRHSFFPSLVLSAPPASSRKSQAHNVFYVCLCFSSAHLVLYEGHLGSIMFIHSSLNGSPPSFQTFASRWCMWLTEVVLYVRLLLLWDRFLKGGLLTESVCMLLILSHVVDDLLKTILHHFTSNVGESPTARLPTLSIPSKDQRVHLWSGLCSVLCHFSLQTETCPHTFWKEREFGEEKTRPMGLRKSLGFQLAVSSKWMRNMEWRRGDFHLCSSWLAWSTRLHRAQGSWCRVSFPERQGWAWEGVASGPKGILSHFSLSGIMFILSLKTNRKRTGVLIMCPGYKGGRLMWLLWN